MIFQPIVLTGCLLPGLNGLYSNSFDRQRQPLPWFNLTNDNELGEFRGAAPGHAHFPVALKGVVAYKVARIKVRVTPLEFPSVSLTTEDRIRMAERCRDCDGIPKALHAGLVVADAAGVQVQVMHNGLKMVLDGYCGPWMTDLITRCGGHHEPQEERLFHEIVSRLPESGTMLELGGWWSFYSLWYMQGSPSRRALVLEPDPAHLAVGKRNAALNGLAPMFELGFVGETFAENMLFATEDSGQMSLTCFTVKTLMEKAGFDHLSILHCDAQGAETAVLRSCHDLFAQRKIDWVFVSTHAHQITGDPLTHQRCLSLLRDAGAVIEAEHDVHESFSGDGLIVARFCEQPPAWQPVQISYNRHSTSLFRDIVYDFAQARGTTE